MRIQVWLGHSEMGQGAPGARINHLECPHVYPKDPQKAYHMMCVLKMKQKSDFPVDQTCFWAGLELLHKGEDWKESANHSAILDGLHLSSCLDLASKDSQSVVKVLITKRCTFQVTVCCCLKPIADDIPLCL